MLKTKNRRFQIRQGDEISSCVYIGALVVAYSLMMFSSSALSQTSPNKKEINSWVVSSESQPITLSEQAQHKKTETEDPKTSSNEKSKSLLPPHTSAKSEFSEKAIELDRAQLNKIISLQFNEILKLEETEDAFDERFGELYFAYGRSLLNAGEIDEAIGMFKNTLHNIKINNGVRGIEQRPILRALFEANLATDRHIEAEQHLKHLLWIDRNHSSDMYSMDIVIKMANYFFDQFRTSRTVTEQGLIGLNKSIGYFRYAIQNYNHTTGKTPLPYGDFAHAHYLKTLVHSSTDPELYVIAQRKSLSSLRGIGVTRAIIENSFMQSDFYLKQAYEQAKKSLDLNVTIKSLIQLGDLHILYGSLKGARTYYKFAYELALALPKNHPIPLSFTQPVKLPAFELSNFSRNHQKTMHEIVPMLIDIDKNGYVSSASRVRNIEFPMGLRIRAKNIAKALRFRPIINMTGLTSYSDLQYDVKVTQITPPSFTARKFEE